MADPGWHAATFQGSGNVIDLGPDEAPAIIGDEKVLGGARTVQLQNVDPFAAFARGRLGIRDIPRIESGLPAALKGNVAHQVLHALFACKPDSTAIATWDTNEVSTRIQDALESVIASASRPLSPLHRKLLSLERGRLGKILLDFVEAERSREGFTVESVEERIEFERYGVRLDLRVDRVDRLVNNSLLIIDYKTGQSKALLNRDGELNDLQLIVYATALEADRRGRTGGIVLVNLDSRAISYKGVGDSVPWGNQHRDEWGQKLSSWMKVVDTAIRQIAAGDVRVNLDQPGSQARPLALLSRFVELTHE
jgi:RecB family exonuclease